MTSRKQDQKGESTIAGALYFFEQTIRRTTDYLRDVGDLVRAGSIEPRLWIGSIESFWSGLAEDFGDSLRISHGSSEADRGAARAKDVPVLVVRVNLGLACDVGVDVPESAFPPGVTEVDLELQGFWRGQNLVLRPGVHFTPGAKARRDDRHVPIRFFDLPKLSLGVPFVGTLLAKAGDQDPRLAGIIVVQRL